MPPDPAVDDCAICDIVNGRTPAHIVQQDRLTVAFLAAYPATRGHTLIVTRDHRRDIWDLSRDEAAATMVAAGEVATRLRERLRATGLNLSQANGASAEQSIFHFHLHVVPRYAGDRQPPRWSGPAADPAELALVFDACTVV